MIYIVPAFLASFILCLILIKYSKINGGAALDKTDGVQKFHKGNIPRIGGMAIFGGLLVPSVIFYLKKEEFANEYLLLVLSSIPIVLSGFMEDLTKKISPFLRLGLGFLSALIAFFILNARLSGMSITGIHAVDSALSLLPVSLVFTVFAVAGVSNSINIIDGFNGLASGVSIMIFLAFAYVAFLLHDHFVFYTSVIMVFAIFGFFIWNYPFGHIFMGDGGAYLVGFVIAVTSILLVKDNRRISPWFPMLVVIYPVWETLFSAIRRKFLRNRNPVMPDALHFHSLVFRRIITKTLGGNNSKNMIRRNSATSVYLWIIELFCIVPAVEFRGNTRLLMAFSAIFIAGYTWFYFSIVKFKIPGFLKSSRNRGF